MHEVRGQFVLLDLDLGFSAIESSRICDGRSCGALVDLGAVRVVLEAVLALEVLVHLGLDELSGHGNVDLLEELVEDLVAGLDALGELLAFSACAVMSARSSSSVSNSEAIWAKSSSGSGSSRSLTAAR